MECYERHREHESPEVATHVAAKRPGHHIQGQHVQLSDVCNWSSMKPNPFNTLVPLPDIEGKLPGNTRPDSHSNIMSNTLT